jgi:signal transduction histidine kinase
MTSRLLSLVGPQEIPPSAANVSDLLRELEAFIRYSVGSGIQIRLELSADLPNCFLDPSQFNAAILNLVVNARDAMPDGGVIEISTKLQDGYECNSATEICPVVRVRVKDNGRGMSPDVQKKVFDPYFTTKGDAGTGLGVPQVCAFMKRVNGSVIVESALGVGTVFDLLFPVQAAPASADPRLWRQIDRWVNEGGAEPHQSSGPVKTGP